MGKKSDVGKATDLEWPEQNLSVKDFYMDTTPVTNEEFSKFIKETNYVTDAEKIGTSYVFKLLIDENKRNELDKLNVINWWYDIKGATWKTPEGPNTNIDSRMDHPVVHVSRNDALEYCKWAGKRLPTEFEFEYAARAGLIDKNFPWGNEVKNEKGEWLLNIWQGKFPITNDVEDGYLGTAPVKAFPPNNFGLYQMVGNVWEWQLNRRWIPLDKFKNFEIEKEWDKNNKISNDEYALRGGSFLCTDDFCARYRVFSRNGNSAKSTSSNLSFRCVK